ncbi:MAG: hypothetical protein ACRC57_02770 [Sarcina sp.]
MKLISSIIGVTLISAGLFFANLKYIENNKQKMQIHHIQQEESKEAKSKFKEKEFENIKIRYIDKQEKGLPIIEEYINESILFNEKIFGNFNKRKLRIVLDYNEEAFKSRNKFKDAIGYFIVGLNTMYFLVDDVEKDIINGVEISELEDGTLITKNFQKTFLHEMNHYYTINFIKENKIEVDKFPMWFIEGLAEFAGNKGKMNIKSLIFGTEEFKSLDSLNNNDGLISSANAYEQANFAIDKLIYENDISIIKDIILECKNKDFNDAFEFVLGKSIKVFEEELKEDFNNGFEKNFSYDRGESNIFKSD